MSGIWGHDAPWVRTFCARYNNAAPLRCEEGKVKEMRSALQLLCNQLAHPRHFTVGAGARMQLVAVNTQHTIGILFNIETGIEIARTTRFFKIGADDPLIPQI